MHRYMVDQAVYVFLMCSPQRHYRHHVVTAECKDIRCKVIEDLCYALMHDQIPCFADVVSDFHFHDVTASRRRNCSMCLLARDGKHPQGGDTAAQSWFAPCKGSCSECAHHLSCHRDCCADQIQTSRNRCSRESALGATEA